MKRTSVPLFGPLVLQEQHQQLEKARQAGQAQTCLWSESALAMLGTICWDDFQADEKEIQNLQREVANAESKLADQEHRVSLKQSLVSLKQSMFTLADPSCAVLEVPAVLTFLDITVFLPKQRGARFG